MNPGNSIIGFMNVTAAEASLNRKSVSVLCKAVRSGFANVAESINASQMRGGLVKSLRYVILLRFIERR